MAIPPRIGGPACQDSPFGPSGRGGRAPLVELLGGQTLPRSQSQLRSKFKLPLAIVVVQLCAVDKLFAARIAHRRREEDHRETIRACGQPLRLRGEPTPTSHSFLCTSRRVARSVEPTRTCTAMTATSRKHQRLRLLREYHLPFQGSAPILRIPDGWSMPRRCLIPTFSRRRPQVKRHWILTWVHRYSAKPTQRMVPTLGTDLSVDNRATLVSCCTSSVLPRLSLTAADGGTLDTDRLFVRGVCTVTAGSREVLGGELGFTLTTSLRSKTVRFSSQNFKSACKPNDGPTPHK